MPIGLTLRIRLSSRKDEPWCTQITASGNIFEYYRDTTTHCASMETIKYHWNSVLSTLGAKYCTADISNMYLCSELPDAQYHEDSPPPRILRPSLWHVSSVSIPFFINIINFKKIVFGGKIFFP